MRRICVYCASSSQCDPAYFQVAEELGRELARASFSVIYGGGAVGLMGALADGVLAEGGDIVGVIPEFMKELEWAHNGVRDMRVVEDMHERKSKMIEEADAFIALPGGCGTLEELLEAITWKRLGIHAAPVIIVNTNGFYNPLLDQLQACVEQKFMNTRHAEMWAAVETVEQVLPLLRNPPLWDPDARRFAQM
ncbi:MAG: TIGR00730 family Rossman fold protein [Planctomycetota bacterium]